MKKYISIVLFLIIGLVIGAFCGIYTQKDGGYIPSFQVMGDVNQVLTIDSLEEYEQMTFVHDEKKSGATA